LEWNNQAGLFVPVYNYGFSSENSSHQFFFPESIDEVDEARNAYHQ
jgi:hypothetical protein